MELARHIRAKILLDTSLLSATRCAQQYNKLGALPSRFSTDEKFRWQISRLNYLCPSVFTPAWSQGGQRLITRQDKRQRKRKAERSHFFFKRCKFMQIISNTGMPCCNAQRKRCVPADTSLQSVRAVFLFWLLPLFYCVFSYYHYFSSLNSLTPPLKSPLLLLASRYNVWKLVSF